MMTERNLTMGGEHTMQYIYALLLNCTPETYWILLTNNTINNKKWAKEFNKPFSKENIQKSTGA